MIGSSGCDNRVEKNEFIEKVKVFEMNEIKLDGLQITYDKFKENLNGIFTQKYEKYYLENKDKRYFLSVEGKDLRMKDIENINEEAFQEYQKIIEKSSKEKGIQQIDSKIEISDANYEAINEDEKKAYSKITQIVYYADKEPVKTIVLKAYYLKKTDKQWKISKIVRVHSKGSRSNGIILNAIENRIRIKYVESINLTYNPSK